jgi:hypothetical protein
MNHTSDVERRQLIMQKSQPTPVDQRGVFLDLRISLNGNGSFIRVVDGGAPDLSCSTDHVVIAELAKLVELLRREQLKREAGNAG